MNVLSNTSVKQPRRQLIASIQCESKKLKQLEAENLELKSTLQDYELVMKLMSQKYRNHVSKLISHMNAENKLNLSNVINAKYKQKVDEQALKIEQLTAFIQKIMNLDIQNFLDIQKSLTRLELENEGLRQMLGIAKEHSNFKPNASTAEIAVQAGSQEDDLELQNGVSGPESRPNDVASKANNLENSVNNSGASNRSSPSRLNSSADKENSGKENSGKENDNEANSLNNENDEQTKTLDQVNSTSTIKKFVKEFVNEQKDKKSKQQKVPVSWWSPSE